MKIEDLTLAHVVYIKRAADYGERLDRARYEFVWHLEALMEMLRLGAGVDLWSRGEPDLCQNCGAPRARLGEAVKRFLGYEAQVWAEDKSAWERPGER